MKFLVTGGAGFIGSHIVEALVGAGLGEVVVFDDFSSGHERNLAHLAGRVEIIPGDVRRTSDVSKAMEVVCLRYFNVATGVETSLKDVIAALEKVSGKKIKPRFEPAREGDIPRSVADISRAKELLGYEPEVSLEQGLRKLLQA